MLTNPELKALEEKFDQLQKLYQVACEDNAKLRKLLADEQSANCRLQERVDLAAGRLQKLLDNLSES
ncbi:MAG: hypothetical protein RQ714_05860 [Nitrosomonas sp.]|nr:hypothetical protein [Nitrosomonas sp.]